MTRELLSKLNWIHLIVGVAGLLAFLGTGAFMDRRLVSHRAEDP
jgi:uncharacterized protein YneF (UPF0154 family)